MALPFAQFMEESLYGVGGYYTQGLNFLGTPPRDFTTAPELTPLFGATLAHWVAQQWQALGSPGAWRLTELGPGRGSLMHPLLTQLKAAHPACFTALQQVQLVECAPALRQLQQQTLAPWGSLCAWPAALPMPDLQLPTVLMANEVLDALPAQPYRLHSGAWQALHVDDNALVWLPSAAPPLPYGWQPTAGAVLEHLPALAKLLSDIQAYADAALLIDYGAATLPPQGADTLQALHHHTPVPLLHQPTQTDLTTHVNFGEVAHQLGAVHCTLTPLADFLLQHGLPQLALPLLPHAGTESALQRLLHPAQMGTLHKALCYTRNTR